MRRNPKPTSGISKTIQLLPYRKFLPFEQYKNNIKDLYCYQIQHYGNSGISVLIHRSNDRVLVKFGDWIGNIINIKTNDSASKTALQMLRDKQIELLLKTMRLIKLDQAQYFFAIHNNEIILVDIQLNLNKMAGPGMIKDIFGNVLKTQHIIDSGTVDIDQLSKKTGIIIKPSKFRMLDLTPLYLEL